MGLGAMLVFSSAWAGTVDLGRGMAIDIPGLSQTFLTADSVLQALPTGTAPADFARTMEILRRAYATLPKDSRKEPLKWAIAKPTDIKSERDKLIYTLYSRTPRDSASADAMGMPNSVRVSFAYSYARYLFEDATTVGGGLNPDRSQKTKDKEAQYAFFRTPYTYVAWGLFQADRGFTELKTVNPHKSPAEQKDDLWGKICPDIRSARFTFLTALDLDRAQPLPGFAVFGNKAFAAFTKAAQMSLPNDVQAITGAHSYAELCQLPAKDLVNAAAAVEATH